MTLDDDVLVSVGWEIKADESRVQRRDSIVLSSHCSIDSGAGSIFVVPLIHLQQRPDQLQARIIYAESLILQPPPQVWVSVDLGPHEDCFGVGGQLVLDVLKHPALRVVLCCGEHRLNGTVQRSVVLRPRADIRNHTTDWIADDHFLDVYRGVLKVISAHLREAEGIG